MKPRKKKQVKAGQSQKKLKKKIKIISEQINVF